MTSHSPLPRTAGAARAAGPSAVATQLLGAPPAGLSPPRVGLSPAGDVRE